MKQRTSKPVNNKYYIRLISGGLNGAVQGYPVDKTANVLSNCVGYANGRFNESINDPELTGIYKKFKYQLVCNAENFIERAKQQGLKISEKPVLGGIMVWQKGSTLDDYDGAGHVEFVEDVINANKIKCSGSAYGSYAFKVITRTNDNGRWGMGAGYTFRGCVVNPTVFKFKAEKRYIEITSYRNAYSDPYKTEFLVKVPKGAKVYTTKRCGKWLYVPSYDGWICETDSKIGFCVKTIVMSTKQYKTLTVMKLRKYPSTSSAQVGVLSNNKKFKGRDVVDNWVWCENKGWICTEQGKSKYVERM